MRRTHLPPLLAALFVAVHLVAGCGAAPRAKVVLGTEIPLVFGVAPFMDDEALRAGLQPLLDRLGRELRRPVRLRIAASYRDLDELAGNGRIDFGWFSPSRRENPPGRPAIRVVACPRLAAPDAYRGLLVVRRDGPTDLAGLKGKTVAFVDPESKSGFLVAVRLLREAGIDPLRDFAAVRFTGNHERSLDGLLAGSFDAAAVTSLLAADPRYAARFSGEIRILAETAPIAPDPFVTAVGYDAELKRVFGSLTNPDGTVEAALRGTFGILGFEVER